LNITYHEFAKAMNGAGAKADLIEKIATKVELSPGEHSRIQNKVLKKVAPPMITIGLNRTAVKDSRGSGLPEKSERTKKALKEIMAKRSQSVANKVGISRESLIKKLEEKCKITRRNKEELSEQDLFRRNVELVAAKMTLTNPESMKPLADPNGLTPKPYSPNTVAAQTLKNQPNHETLARKTFDNITAQNKPSTAPALDASILPTPNVQYRQGRNTLPVNGKNSVKGDLKWDGVSPSKPKKAIKNNDPNSSYTGAI
jgi:hypothetical protein